ncbi:MAG: hypothetical protein IPN05_14740 [Sulfuritalea sp.]|nr:hypothetical protein [Sulfuritalea sp.]
MSGGSPGGRGGSAAGSDARNAGFDWGGWSPPHFARMGRSLKYRQRLESITRQFEATRFGSVTPNDEGPGQVNNAQAGEEVLTPLQILRKLETGGDEAQMEHWTQVDGSESGIGFIVPAVLPRHRIGVLLCFRETDGMDWRMGVIRRIGRDAANRPSVGIETLAWPSICALAKPCGQESAWTKVADGGGHGWSDANFDRIKFSRIS